jgi:hypothetical protein
MDTAVIAAWGAGLLTAFGLLACRWRRTSALIHGGAPAPPEIEALTGDLAAMLALRRVPRVLMSADVDTPLVSGLVRPVVLLPIRFTDLARRQQRLAVCHELLHIARGDLWLGWVPALAERVFFFHPLVHLAAREYVFWRESACDAAVLETLHAGPREYGRLLLDLGVSAPRRSLAAAGASWSFSNLKRRIHMLGHFSRASRSRASRFAAVMAVLLALGAWVPLRLVARPSVAPDTQGLTAQRQLPAPATQPQPVARPQEAAAPAPSAKAAPSAEVAQGRRSVQADTRDLSYVLIFNDGERIHSSGSRSDIERARSFRRGNEPLLWFQNADGEFVVRDPAILQQVEDVWKPVGEIGGKQGQLGAQQGELGAKQGQLGAEQAKLGAEQAALGARQAAIGAKQAQLGAEEWNASKARRAEIDKRHQDLDKEMRALDEEMRALGARMRELEKPMRELGTDMDRLGNEMDALGREMERASERAQAEMRALFDRAVASGKAERVR